MSDTFRRNILNEIDRFHRLHIHPESRILAVSPRAEQILENLGASYGHAWDPLASENCAFFQEADPFDAIIISQVIPSLPSLIDFFHNLVPRTDHRTRILIDLYNNSLIWRKALPYFGMSDLDASRAPTWIGADDLINVLELTGFEVVALDRQMLVPITTPVIDGLINRLMARLPYFNRLDLLVTAIARRPMPVPAIEGHGPSATVVVTCKNEVANIEPTARRIPEMGSGTTIIFVEGGSTDGTPEEIDRVIQEYPDREIRHVTQPGKGKSDAMHTGFKLAESDIIIQFDSDLTMDPEVLSSTYHILAWGSAEYVMATRAVYPKELGAMRLLNRFANWLFALYFSWILGQRITDTLGGLKGIRKCDYASIMKGRRIYGDIDPFGDFDLLFGATMNGLCVRELPVRYYARSYGSPQISRFRDGWMLIKMCCMILWRYKLRG